jgi:hypothetical protein
MRETFRHCRLLASMLAVTAAAPPALLGQEDLTLPPRLDEDEGEPVRPSEMPQRARLEPRTDGPREEPIEEVLVVREDPWRLPDLGSEWRARQQDEVDTGRITAEFLPLYDPEDEDPFRGFFLLNREMQRVGFIEVFRIRFGDR